MYKSGKKFIKRVVLDSIARLVDESAKIYHTDKKLSRRYMEIAWKMVMRYKAKLPDGLKKKFCRKCLSPSILGETSEIKSGFYHCLVCGYRRKLKQ
ncbi:hypothetical protein JXB01_04210 [Candidatus Micrarchaeota archaeon]|nr:hypothetical protein [Candidatus Micrarchaeota archaeon]